MYLINIQGSHPAFHRPANNYPMLHQFLFMCAPKTWKGRLQAHKVKKNNKQNNDKRNKPPFLIYLGVCFRVSLAWSRWVGRWYIKTTSATSVFLFNSSFYLIQMCWLAILTGSIRSTPSALTNVCIICWNKTQQANKHTQLFLPVFLFIMLLSFNHTFWFLCYSILKLSAHSEHD